MYLRRCLCAFVLALIPLVASAENPRVDFDVTSLIAARPLNDADFARTNPRHKLVALQFSVTTFQASGTSAEECTFTFDVPSDDFAVVDYLPKTTLETRFTGPVSVETIDERELKLNADAAGYAKHITGAAAELYLHDHRYQHAGFQLLPPLETSIAAGTVQRGRGVSFKLRPSPRSTLEGSKVFLITAKVPRAWRGEMARVSCSAFGDAATFIPGFNESIELGRREFLAAVYLEGDAAAEWTARRFLASEQVLRRTAERERRAIEKRAGASLLQKIGVEKSDLPSDWLNRWLMGPSQPAVLTILPPPVRDAAVQYATARAQFHRLNGETR